MMMKMVEITQFFFHAVGQSKVAKLLFCVAGVMSTLLLYGILQERIMKSPYGEKKEYMKYSLLIVLCNRVLTCIAAALYILIARKDMAPVAPVYKYGAVSLSNVLATTCQYEALKHVSFPVQTLGKCAKTLPVMVWGTFIARKRYNTKDYLVAGLITVGCAVFFLTAASAPLHRETESTVWGLALMSGYLGFDGFTSTFQDKLFKGYNMDIFNQILYTTLCSGVLSIIGLVSQGQWFLAIDFVLRHPKCLYDILLLSCAATTSQFFISYTIRTFGALFFATLMTTRQLLSIIISCVLFAHPLTAQQWGAAVVVFGALYSKSYLSSRKRGDKAVSLRPGSKDPEEEQLILPIKVGDMDASRQHVLVVKDMDIQGSRTS
ncbi:unnamed protein product [Calypogeia fissa]